MLRVWLLGRPRLEVDGEPRPLGGRKTWGLLTFLLLEPRAPARRELAERLWPEADDPLRAARWALHQVRRAIAPAEIVERDGRLALSCPAGLAVDVRRAVDGAIDPDEADELIRGGLLEGMTFPDAPAFDSWLDLHRHRVASASTDALRWAAVVLTRRDPERALRLAERALLAEPFDDALHELLVDIHVTRGDRRSAEAHLDRVERTYRAELGVGAPAEIRRPLERPVPPPTPLVSLDVAARALLQAAQGKLDAGDYDGALETARRAATDAAASGDRALEARALVTLAGALIHTLRGRDHESLGLLAHASQLATALGDDGTIADIELEIGFVALLDARYGAAESALSRSIQAATKAGDPARAGRASNYLGLARSDRADYEAAADAISRAASLLDRDDTRVRHAYARTLEARLLMRTGSLARARAVGLDAASEARAAGGLAIVSFPLAVAAEAAMLQGDDDAAEALGGEAFTLGSEIGDPCWEGMGLRVLGLVQARRGDRERAHATLAEALRLCTRLADTYRFGEAEILTDLVEMEQGRDRARLGAALALTRRAPMPELAARLRSVAGQQTPAQTPSR